MPILGIWVYFAVIAVILVFFKAKLPYLIGRKGERFITGKLLQLDVAHYKILNDLLIPSNGRLNTTQIDHVVISNYGIFCIETKTYKGWIFGNASQDYWTQIIYRYKNRFYSPLRQNYAHVKAIEELIRLKYPNLQICSLVAFPNADKLRISGTNSVGSGRDVIDKIKTYQVQVLSDTERDEIYDILLHANIKDKEIRRSHDQGVRMLK